MTILVTGATGTTGNATLHALVDLGVPVRALVRDPAKLDAPADVEVVTGSFGDAASLDRALDGVEGAYLVDISSVNQVAEEQAFVEAAQRAGLARLVVLSVVGADQPGIEAVRIGAGHAQVEAIVRESGVPHTFLRPNGFFQNQLANAESISTQNAFYSPLSPAAVVSYVDVLDIAAVAAHVLTNPGHEGQGYTLTGSEPLSDDDVAAHFTKVLGREITHVQVPVEAAQDGLRAAGLDDWYVAALSELFAFYETGLAGAISPDVEQVLGRAPRTIEQFIEANAAAFGG